MLNKLGTTEDMIEYHENGNIAYDFMTDSDGVIEEMTFDKNVKILAFKNSHGFSCFYTRDDQSNELAFKNSKGNYKVKGKFVTQEEYEAFIKELEKKQTAKLYLLTEEQLDTMLYKARLHKQDDTEMFTNEYLLSQETPIELPSDEKLKEISRHEILYNDSKREWWIEGSKYILNLIKQQI